MPLSICVDSYTFCGTSTLKKSKILFGSNAGALGVAFGLAKTLKVN